MAATNGRRSAQAAEGLLPRIKSKPIKGSPKAKRRVGNRARRPGVRSRSR